MPGLSSLAKILTVARELLFASLLMRSKQSWKKNKNIMTAAWKPISYKNILKGLFCTRGENLISVIILWSTAVMGWWKDTGTGTATPEPHRLNTHYVRDSIVFTSLTMQFKKIFLITESTKKEIKYLTMNCMITCSGLGKGMIFLELHTLEWR